MAESVHCPVCNENNPADEEFCQFCQSRLRPLTGALKGADAPLHPGQIPTKKVTAELEPILPQWLREARDKARQSVDEDIAQVVKPQPVMQASADADTDLLAGLRSQGAGDDDEETPDWLATITGAPPKLKKAGPSSGEGRRVELGAKDDFAPEPASSEEGAPAWLTVMQASAPEGDRDELTEWFRESSGLDAKGKDAPPMDSPPQPGFAGVAAGIESTERESLHFESSDAPEWLNPSATEAEPSGSFGGDLPSWLGSAASSPASPGGPGAGPTEAEIPSGETPNWLQGFESTSSSMEDSGGRDWLKEHETKTPEAPLKKHTTPLWLRDTEEGRAAAAEPETPIWLADSQPAPAAPGAASEPAPASSEEDFGDIPGWLKAAAPQSSVFSEAPAEQPPFDSQESPDWLSTFKSSAETSTPVRDESISPFDSTPSEPQGNVPAFTANAFPQGSVDELFTEMPDWLSSAVEAAPGPASAVEQESLLPGELPSWVRAMRPVDTSLPKPAPSISDQTLEARGALGGLSGVLPAAGYAPTSKPKAYSIKLQATQGQQAQAALLEQILAAEAEPVPIISYAPLRRSRGLRWFISFVAIFLVISAVSLKTSVFSMPVSVPSELGGALRVAQQVTADAPVLVAVDYHPARAAEMEAAAAPMFDQMMVLQHPRLTFVSTNETGPVLVERFLSGPLKEREYQYGSQYVNLGYLPGGVMGIRAFILNSRQAMPYDILLGAAWETAPLLGVQSISQFAALIVITDSADTARLWIEQTTPIRAAVPLPLVVISSAQAAPMIQPYYEAGQVAGIVHGLRGAAVFEQNNAGRPGIVRAYWDAYNAGMLLAMALILGGGLVSSMLALRERAARKGG
jgi:hypothetical protein